MSHDCIFGSLNDYDASMGRGALHFRDGVPAGQVEFAQDASA